MVGMVHSKVRSFNTECTFTSSISKMQMDLMVASMLADFARVFTFQYTNSVGMARMRWLGITEGHHELSHEPDSNTTAMDKLVKINNWFSGQIAYLLKRLKDTPEPGGPGTMLDNTQIVWTNELGKGSSHTLDDIPFVLMGGGLDWKMGRALKYKKVPHNRLLMALAHGFGLEHGALQAQGVSRVNGLEPAQFIQPRRAKARLLGIFQIFDEHGHGHGGCMPAAGRQTAKMRFGRCVIIQMKWLWIIFTCKILNCSLAKI